MARRTAEKHQESGARQSLFFPTTFFASTHYIADPRLLPVSGEPDLIPCSGFVFIAFVMYIITTTMCDGVLHCLWFVFSF